jgi:hypothetical protein
MNFQDDHERLSEILEANILQGEACNPGGICQLVDVRAGYSCHS